MQMDSYPIPLQKIEDLVTFKHGINLYVLRTDLNHEHISGNKWYKLKYNLEAAQNQKKKTLLTFGGAFSNHIAATAAAGASYGFKTIGIIRGEKHHPLNPTLQFATMQGMQLDYVSRELYQHKKELQQYLSEHIRSADVYVIPEGGSNELGMMGCKDITTEIHIPFDHICCACGTGTTLRGILLSLQDTQQALGFQVLKSENYLRSEIENHLLRMGETKVNWHMNETYHFGGYAKTKPALLSFIAEFEAHHGIPLDFIYTGKMMFGIYDLIRQQFFKKGDTIVAVHTGGLQGNPKKNVSV